MLETEPLDSDHRQHARKPGQNEDLIEPLWEPSNDEEKSLDETSKDTQYITLGPHSCPGQKFDWLEDNQTGQSGDDDYEWSDPDEEHANHLQICTDIPTPSDTALFGTVDSDDPAHEKYTQKQETGSQAKDQMNDKLRSPAT